jgi:hypothetical protein
MPADQGFGLDDYERRSPSGPNSKKGNPEGAIKSGEPRASALVTVDLELLAKCKPDDCLLALTAGQGRDRGDEDNRVAEKDSNRVAILKDRGRAVQTEFRAYFQVA